MPAIQGANYSVELYWPRPDYLTVTEVTVGYNNVPLHSRPMAKNVAANVLHRTLVETPGDIVTTYHPILVENNVSAYLSYFHIFIFIRFYYPYRTTAFSGVFDLHQTRSFYF
jgi:hypothetical protein